MHDIIIIGTGIASISAALTLKQLNKDFLLIGSKDLSYKINSAEKIRNYPGLSSISGPDLKKALKKQLEDMEIEIIDKQVTGVYNMTDYYAVLCGNDTFEAKSIILGLGVESVKPLPGEIELLGQGVSYCATCDGFLYKNKDLTIVSTSAEFEDEVEYLASLATNINLICLYKNPNINLPNVTIKNGMAKKIYKENKKMYLETFSETLESDGIFMLKSSISPSVLVPGLEDNNGHIVVDRSCKTNLNGVFACGDCTGRPYQYAKAAGEGNVSAHSAVAYLNELKKQNN